MAPGDFTADYFARLDPFDLSNVVREQGRWIDAKQKSTLDVEEMADITPKIGQSEWRISAEGSDILRMIISGADIFDEFGIHANLAGFDDSGTPKVWIDALLGTIHGVDADIAGTIAIGTGSSAGGWFINSTQIFNDSITLDSTKPAIMLGAATDYLTGAGIFLGKNAGVYKASFGDPAGTNLTWDGSSLAASGNWIKGAGVDASLQSWETDIVFSSASDTQINWTSGTIAVNDGTTYSISSGNTGTMAALTYIYFDKAVSTTALQVTTTYSTAVGAGKILIASAQNNTAGASVIPFAGQQPLINGGAQITALSILAGNIAAGAITATKISVTSLSAITATMGSLTIDSTLTMSGASSAIAIGSTPPSSATVGTGLWIDRTGVYSLLANVQQATLTSTGFVAGATSLNSSGIAIEITTVSQDGRSYKFTSGGASMGGLYDYLATGVNTMIFQNSPGPGVQAYTNIIANPSGTADQSQVQIVANGPGRTAYLLLAQDGTGNPGAILSGDNIALTSTSPNTSTEVDAAHITTHSTGTTAPGFGARLSYNLDNDSGIATELAYFGTTFSEVTNGAEVGRLVGGFLRSGSFQEVGLGTTLWMPYAFPIGGSPANAGGTAITLAANGGSCAVPICVDGPMLLHAVAARNLDTATARTWMWDLYKQTLNNGNAAENTLSRVATGAGAQTFTPTVASSRTLNALNRPIYLEPGIYWLVIQNQHATSTFALDSTGGGIGLTDAYQTKTTTNPNGATLDFVAATWAVASGAVPSVVLKGRVFGSTSPY